MSTSSSPGAPRPDLSPGPVARVWRGVVASDRLADYVEYVEATGVGAYRRTPGNQAAHILTRDLGNGTAELIAFSLWDSVESVRRFAGEDITAMVLYREDHDYLVAPPTLTHHRVEPPGPAPTKEQR